MVAVVSGAERGGGGGPRASLVLSVDALVSPNKYPADSSIQTPLPHKRSDSFNCGGETGPRSLNQISSFYINQGKVGQMSV